MLNVEVRDVIRQIGDKEPLNPYQVAGMAAVISRSGVALGASSILNVNSATVLMLLDRAGGEASPYLIDLRHADSHITIFARFPRESLEELVFLTSFQGRRQAILETLVPVLYKIPNWLDLVQTLSEILPRPRR